jgi:hypothetical protein
MAKQYQLTTGTATPGFTPTLVSGRFLAHHRYDAIGSAFLALDLYIGAKQPADFTMRQAAWLARANETYAWHAFNRQAERAAIEAGYVPLVPAAPRARDGNNNGSLALVAPDSDIDDTQLAIIARIVGSDRMLAAAIEATH